MKRKSKRWIFVIAAALVAAAVLAGSVVARLAEPPDSEALHAAVLEAPMTRVADLPATATAEARGAFVQVTSTGHVCLWDAPSADSRERGGGCNPVADPLGGSELSASLAYDGGPGVEQVSDARLIGLASPRVAEITILMSDGSRREIPLRRASVAGKELRAFAYRFKTSDLRKGVGPVAVIAADEEGQEIGRQPTGIGG